MKPARRILQVTDWLPPDFGAVGQYALQDARGWAREGADVLLLGLGMERAGWEVEDCPPGSLAILRLPALDYERSRWGVRAIWIAAVHLRLLVAAARFLPSVDEVRCSESPPFLVYPLTWLARRHGVRLVYRLTDVFPEVLWAEHGGIPPKGLGWLQRAVARFRKGLDCIEVLGEDARERLLELGVAPERVVVRRDGPPIPIRGDEPPSDRPEVLQGKVVLLYSGNFGVAHEDETVLEGLAHHHHHGSGRVALWLNATGTKAGPLAARLRARGVPVAWTPPVALSALPFLLRAADAHLITLRDPFVGLVLPSKVYAILALGGPLLFVGSAKSDVARLATRELPPERFFRVDVGDVLGFAQALEVLADRFSSGAAPSRVSSTSKGLCCCPK